MNDTNYIWIILIALTTFLVCFLVDKVFNLLFRSRRQHQSRRQVRLRRRMAAFGLIVAVLGAACVIFYWGRQPVIFWSGVALLLMGGAMVVYYVCFGVFYDEEGFLHSTFGKKPRFYNYRQIRFQQLYNSQGSIVVELHLEGGDCLQIQDSMEGAWEFLDYAYEMWRMEKGLSDDKCAFHNADKCQWFPQVEVF